MKLFNFIFTKPKKEEPKPKRTIETHDWEANARRYDNMIEHNNRGRTC